MQKLFYSRFLLVLVGCLFIAGCSKSDDQRQFENHATSSEPSGITETDANGEMTGSTDQDDWRIAPMFSGLIQIETPAYPNPVSFNSGLRIDVYITGLETISSMEVYAYEFPNRLYGPLNVIDNLSSTSLVTINLNAESVAGSSGGSGASGTYRILIYDGRQNLISYGDVEIQ